MREHFEKTEETLLSSFAIKSNQSLGRKYPEEVSITRTCFQRDRDRIIHSKAFRRLKHKTQVFVATLSDHYRSRLTHTIEVAQISRHLARLLKLNEDLSECIALAHDLGHTPFGHSGEEQLNELLIDDGGFEHNLHSLRIVDELEQKYPLFPGLNLSFEVKEGLKKHHTPWDSPNSETSFISGEAQIANLADEIAYNNHDIDDGLNSQLLQFEELKKHVTLFKEANKKISNKFSNLKPHEKNHLINSHIISQQVMDAFQFSQQNITKSNIFSVNDLQKLSYSIISFSEEMTEKNNELRLYLLHNMYRHPNITKTNKKGQKVISLIFNHLKHNESDIPEKYLKSHHNTKVATGYYVAGMTDKFALSYCFKNNLLTQDELEKLGMRFLALS